MPPDLDAEASTLQPLPHVLSRGLIPVALFGLLSFVCSVSLFVYLTHRLLSWRRHTLNAQGTNQFVVLIYNLLLADIQQSLAFLLNIQALRRRGIYVGTSTCWAQGWFISTGDLASSVFITAIAVHTFVGVVRQHRVATWAFYLSLVGCWAFVYTLAVIGPLVHGSDFYTRAAAWCWINHKYNAQRLWLHYLWMFICMFATVLIYILIFLDLARRARRNPDLTIPHGARPAMILYPAIYVVCTIPLAAGRIATLAGRDVPLAYFCVAGAMIACNGWLDVLLYGITRAEIVFSDAPPGEETGLATFGILGLGRSLGTTTVIEGGRAESRMPKLRSSRVRRRSESVENLYAMELGMGGMGKIEVKGEVVVRSRDADEGELRQLGMMHGRKGSLSEIGSVKSADGWKGRSDHDVSRQ